MKVKRVISLLLLFPLLFSLSGCSQSDYMIAEGSFTDIAQCWNWFFDTLTPSFFSSLAEAWKLNSVIGFVIALLMSVLMLIVYIVLLVVFLVIIFVLFVLAIVLTILGYLAFAVAAIARFLFKNT